MLHYFLKRLLGLLPTLFLVAVIDPSLQQQVTALMNALLAWHSQLTK